MLKLIHTADWHYSRQKAADVFASMDTLEQHADGVDLIVAAGDLWDSPVQNTGAAQFPEYIARMQRLADKAPLVMVQGTPSHDADGSLDIFEKASDWITVLRPGKSYFLTTNDTVRENAPFPDTCRALIFGVPEPQKKWLIASGTDVTMDQALQALFMGYAAIRQQYPALPCILVYHGQVRGARMVNGTPAEHGVSIDDLALVGADYIAMGDIHLPQRVGETRGLQAYYPGALHPTGDWKDSDYQFGFNRVEIVDARNLGVDQLHVEVTRIDLPHPVLTKITGKAGDNLALINHERSFAGKRVWLECAGSKQDQAILDTEGLLRSLLDLGAAPGSRVTFKVNGIETVRAGTISALRKLSDKFKLWAENSGRALTDSQLEKADLVEQEAAGQGLKLNGGHFSFDRLTLRGSKGIWKNQRKDEITLDLTTLDPGIVGLIGPNGHGKTTIMNNFHPWPEMPNFGSDPLYKHFRLKDSLREVWMTDHLTGIRYRSQIKINATGKTVEYFLFQGDGQTWEPVPGIDGRLKSYDQEVNRIFGSLEMYLRTAMQMQFPTTDHPDLSRATKGTKKQIMSALAGLDFYDLYRDSAKQHAATIEADTQTMQTSLQVLTESIGDHDELESTWLLAEQEVRRLDGIMPVKLASGKALADEVKLLEARKQDQAVIREQIAGYEAQIASTIDKAAGAQQTINQLAVTINCRPDAEADVAKYQNMTAKETALNAEKTRILESNNKVMRDYQEAKRGYDQQREELDGQIKVIERKYSSERAQVDQSMVLAQREISRFTAELAAPVADHCPTCRQMLPADALAHVQTARDATQLKLEDQKASVAFLEAKQHELDQQSIADIQPLSAKLAALVPPEAVTDLPGFDESALTAIRRQLLDIDITAARRILDESAGAQARIDELTNQINDLRTQADAARVKAVELKTKIDHDLDGLLRGKTAELEAARTEYEQLGNERSRAQANAEHAKDRFQKFETDSKRIDELKAKIAAKQVEAADWRLLEQGCGPNGIQALELDAVCPTIASVANKLLEEYEDGRYQIRFDTTREGGKGNQIEDFLIQVIDSRDGGEQEFETLSGGECVWIRKALQDAFGIIRGQNAGIKYLTGFLDESDSALFPEARIAYFRMLESAHQQSVRRHTVMVTHSSEIQEMISTKVEVTKL